MILWNCKSPNIIYTLLPWFVPYDKTKYEIASELYFRLKDKPEETFCVVCYEDDKLEAYIVCYIRDDCCFVWQARVNSGFKYSWILFDAILKWSELMGKREVRCGTDKKTAKFFERKYKFKPSDNEEMVYYV